MEFDICGADAGVAITISHLERRWCINPNEGQTGALADFLIGPAARGACRAGSCDGRGLRLAAGVDRRRGAAGARSRWPDSNRKETVRGFDTIRRLLSTI